MPEEGVKLTYTKAEVAALIAVHAALFGLHAKIIRKTANESIISSTTLTNDAELKFSVLANEVWTLLFCLRFNREAGGVQTSSMAFTIPSGATIVRKSIWGSPTSEFDATGSASLAQGDVPLVKYYLAKYLYTGGSNAGTIQLQWAQATSEAKYHYFLINSYIMAHQLA